MFTDILTRYLVTAAINWDKEDNFNKRPCERTNMHLEALITAVNNCGVCFKVWEKQNADGGGSGTYDFTSLMGGDKKLLLKYLPEKLEGVIKADLSENVINLWKVSLLTVVVFFRQLQYVISSLSCTAFKCSPM
jgi:hypothetical protein